MYTNTDITLYSGDPNTGYTRHAITDKSSEYGAFWDDVKQSNIIRSGMSSVDAVSVFIPLGNMPAGVDKFNTGKDLLVRGITAFVFDNTSQATIAASLKTLQANNRVVTVSVADDKRYGSTDMQHWELSCK